MFLWRDISSPLDRLLFTRNLAWSFANIWTPQTKHHLTRYHEVSVANMYYTKSNLLGNDAIIIIRRIVVVSIIIIIIIIAIINKTLNYRKISWFLPEVLTVHTCCACSVPDQVFQSAYRCHSVRYLYYLSLPVAVSLRCLFHSLQTTR